VSQLIERHLSAVCRELRVEETDAGSIERADLVQMMSLLYLIRAFEQQVLVLKDAELIHGPAHTSIGQEAIAAGVAAALRKTDLIASTHRAHGHFLAKAVAYRTPEGYDPLREPLTPEMQQAVNKTLGEIMGLRDGWCQGRGGSMHLYDRESGNLGSNAIVGGGIPLATGAAWAEALRGRDTVVVSFFGDGAINQGCFHEVANMAGLYGVPVIYFVENNRYAVGTATSESSNVPELALRSLGYGIDSLIVDGMDPVAVYLAVRDAARRMRKEPYPFFIEALTYRYLHHAGSLAGSAFGYRSREEEEAWRAKDPIDTFAARLIAQGILSREEVQHLEARAAASVDQAVALCTEEIGGRRVIPEVKWPTPASALVGVRGTGAELAGAHFLEREDVQEWSAMTYVEAVASAMRRAMERDERVIVLGEEVANLRGGAYGATRGLKEAFPERLFNTPISETGFVGMAGGAASVGMRPIVEIMFPDFALMASDQLFNQIGKLRHMYGDRVRFPLVLRTRVAKGYGYGGQHSLDPCALFSLFSGWRIVAPSTAFDYIGLFNTAVRLDDPVLIVEHGMLYAEEGPVPAEDPDYCIRYGRARLARQGSDLTVLTYLTGVRDCLVAAEQLLSEGASVEVIDLRTVDPGGMDYETIGRSVRKTGAVLIVEQNEKSLSVGSRIADEIQGRFFDYLDAPVAHVTAPDVPLPVSRRLEEAILPSPEDIAGAMLSSIDRRA